MAGAAKKGNAGAQPSLCCADRIQAFTDTLSNAVSTAGILGSTDAARFWCDRAAMPPCSCGLEQHMHNCILTKTQPGLLSLPSLCRAYHLTRSGFFMIQVRCCAGVRVVLHAAPRMAAGI